MTPEEITKAFEAMMSHIDLEKELLDWAYRIYADDFYGGFIPVRPPCTALALRGCRALVKWAPRSLQTVR